MERELEADYSRPNQILPVGDSSTQRRLLDPEPGTPSSSSRPLCELVYRRGATRNWSPDPSYMRRGVSPSYQRSCFGCEGR